MRVTVTQEDWDKACEATKDTVYCYNCLCVVAQALAREGKEKVLVMQWYTYINGAEYMHSKPLNKLVVDFDNRKTRTAPEFPRTYTLTPRK